MKLLSIAFLRGNPPLPGFRKIGDGQYRDWTAAVSGPAVLLVSPTGWRLNASPTGDTRTVCEIPRAECVITWRFDADEDLVHPAKYQEPVCTMCKSPSNSGASCCAKCVALAARANESSQPAAGAETPISVTAPAAAPLKRGPGRPAKETP